LSKILIKKKEKKTPPMYSLQGCRRRRRSGVLWLCDVGESANAATIDGWKNVRYKKNRQMPQR
jgi:hypothetical protein